MECCTVQVTHVRDQSSRTMATVPVYKVLHCKLHAAAPDLLAALEMVLQSHEEPDEPMTGLDWSGVRIAVAKAKGAK